MRIEKTPDDLNSQNTAYYNDFMESKTRANKLLRLQASRSSMPGHEIKVKKKVNSAFLTIEMGLFLEKENRHQRD